MLQLLWHEPDAVSQFITHWRGDLDRTAEIELGMIYAATENWQQIREAPDDTTDRLGEVGKRFLRVP